MAPSLIVLTVSLDVKQIELELTVGSELRNCENREVGLGLSIPCLILPSSLYIRHSESEKEGRDEPTQRCMYYFLGMVV